jgi:Ca-activated chloride channel family protein
MDDALVSKDQLGAWLRRPVVQFGAVTALALLVLVHEAVSVQAFADLWLTRDQQAARLLRQRDYAGAVKHFEDLSWQGTAAYRGGMYEEAAAAFGRVATAEGFYNRGNALYKGRDYRGAVRAFEKAVLLAPDRVGARENLELARWTRDYIERQREQSDTENESELSADDIAFDNEENRGKAVEITRESTIERQSAEKWMRTVDTRTADFLRRRFQIEMLRRESEP